MRSFGASGRRYAVFFARGEKNPPQGSVGDCGTLLAVDFAVRCVARGDRRVYSIVRGQLFRDRFRFYHDGRDDSDGFRFAEEHSLLARVYALVGRHGDSCIYACRSAYAGRRRISVDEIRIAGTAGGKVGE